MSTNPDGAPTGLTLTRPRAAPTRLCPLCGMATPRSLDEIKANVTYYRCDACEAVWNIPRDDPNASPTMVTIASRISRR